LAAAGSGCLLAFILILSSCGTVQKTVVAPPQIPGATYVGNQACYECHTNITRMFAASPHARVHVDGVMLKDLLSPALSSGGGEREETGVRKGGKKDGSPRQNTTKLEGQTGCESCHGPGSKHIEGGGGRGKFIINPGKDPSACFECHLQTRAQFNLPQHHPVIEGRMNCVQCHDPHGAEIFKPAGGLAMARLNENCGNCHRDQTRPFVFEHEALREGCTVCHEPHGSINRKLLTASDPNLCLRCHAQVQHGAAGQIFIGKSDHTLLLRQGTCWAAGCHTAVHGSNVHPRMFY
jgi:predicted CXXCH cytochrome family protein